MIGRVQVHVASRSSLMVQCASLCNHFKESKTSNRSWNRLQVEGGGRWAPADAQPASTSTAAVATAPASRRTGGLAAVLAARALHPNCSAAALAAVPIVQPEQAAASLPKLGAIADQQRSACKARLIRNARRGADPWSVRGIPDLSTLPSEFVAHAREELSNLLAAPRLGHHVRLQLLVSGWRMTQAVAVQILPQEHELNAVRHINQAAYHLWDLLTDYNNYPGACRDPNTIPFSSGVSASLSMPQ